MKTFSTKQEFIDVISGITNDGSVILSLKGGKPDIPKEKQFPYVEIAKDLDLETAISNLPTTLRYELITEGYEFLLDGLKFEELDGPDDYWPGRMTSYILRNFPQYEPLVDWSKLKNNYLVMVLNDQPQFVSKVDFNKINERFLSELIAKKPEYADHIDFNRFNTPENAGFWVAILSKQPQFAVKCNWSLISESDKATLTIKIPSIDSIIETNDFKLAGQNQFINNSRSNEDEQLMDDEREKSSWKVIEKINPKVAAFCQIFIAEKEKQNFSITKSTNEQIIISADYPKADESTSYHFDITTSGCEFYFESRNKGVYIEVLNGFGDFDNYFSENKQHGSVIAQILREKYSETFSDIIDSGEDSQIDEDFNIYFIENFVHYILNNVFVEE
jgi:hypothetical protein